MTAEQNQLLRELAERYLWWKPVEQSLRRPMRVAAQVMNLGDYADVTRLVSSFGDEYLRGVLNAAEAGQFNDRSWHYWHYRLGMAELGTVPALPVRKVA